MLFRSVSQSRYENSFLILVDVMGIGKVGKWESGKVGIGKVGIGNWESGKVGIGKVGSGEVGIRN